MKDHQKTLNVHPDNYKSPNAEETMKDIRARWSVITAGKNSGMNRAIQWSPGTDSACASLTRDEIDKLIRWFEGNS